MQVQKQADDENETRFLGRLNVSLRNHRRKEQNRVQTPHVMIVEELDPGTQAEFRFLF